MTEQEKEIIVLMKEWKDEVKELINDYSGAIGKLKEIQSQFDKKFFQSNKEWIMPFIYLIVLLVATLIVSNLFPCGSMEWSDFKVTKECGPVS